MSYGYKIDKAMKFMEACGIIAKISKLTKNIYTSHEALLLIMKRLLPRVDEETNEWYDCSVICHGLEIEPRRFRWSTSRVL